MATTHHHQHNGSGRRTGAVEDFVSAGLQAMTTTPEGLEPLAESITRVNLEWLGLVGRRARAYLELAGRATRCTGPQDVFDMGLGFCEQAIEDYSEGLQRMMHAARQGLSAATGSASEGETRRPRNGR